MKMIIAGCGRIGSELAHMLDAEAHHVTVIDPDPEAIQRLESTFGGRTVTGVAFDRDILMRAGIETTDALAAVFSNDAANLIVARVARDHFHVPVVVARVYDSRNAGLYEHFGLQTVSSTSWGVHRIEQILTSRQMNYLASLGNGEAQVMEMRIPKHLAARPIGDLLVTGEVSIVGLTRGGRTFIPLPSLPLEEGDHLYLSVMVTAIGRLEAMVKQGG